MDRSLPWLDELAGEPAVRRLVRALSLSKRFHFYIVTCKAPAVADALLAVVQRETAEARGGATEIRRIDPYADHEDFTRPIEPNKLIAGVLESLVQAKSSGAPAISNLDATLASPDDDRAWERLFGRMNERRNTIVRALPRELLLCLPPRLDDTFKAAAPDFWSIRSGEYEIGALPPPGGAVETAPAPKVARRIYRPLAGGHGIEAAHEALGIGNEALRRRDGGVALWAFRRMQDIAGELLAEDAHRSEHIEMAERAALGVGRALLLSGDVAAAEEAWREARRPPPRGLMDEAPRAIAQAAPPPMAQAMESSRRHEVFISYVPEDEPFARELEKHLTPLTRRAGIDVWHEGRIAPGEAWDRAIAERLQKADVVLLLISADFLASERAQGEIDQALRMAAERGTRVIPVLLRPCALESTQLVKLQPLPSNHRPISTWDSRDEAWADVVQGITAALASLPSRKR